MTNMAQTLELVERFLSEIPQEIHGTARAVALLRALGLNDSQRIAELLCVSRRMVQKSTNPSSQTDEPRCVKANPGTPKTNPGAPNEPQCAPRAPARAHFVSKPSCEEGRKKEIDVDDARALAVKLLEAGGQALSPIAVSLHIMSEPLGWIDSGADPDLDIVPTIRALAAKAKPQSIQSWRYFGQAVAKSRDARLEGLPPPQSGARSNGPTVRPPVQSKMREAIARHRAATAAAAAASAGETMQ